jgi:hypothetical protein
VVEASGAAPDECKRRLERIDTLFNGKGSNGAGEQAHV